MSCPSPRAGPRRRRAGAGRRWCVPRSAWSGRSGRRVCQRVSLLMESRPPAARDGTCRRRVRLGCWRFRGRRVEPAGADPGRLDDFHAGSAHVTPMVTVLWSQSSRHLLRSQHRADQQHRRQNRGNGERSNRRPGEPRGRPLSACESTAFKFKLPGYRWSSRVAAAVSATRMSSIASQHNWTWARMRSSRWW